MKKPNFKCSECGQITLDGFVEVKYDLEGARITIRNVPAKVCANGHEFVDGFTAENVNRLVDRVLEDVNSFAKKLPRGMKAAREIMIAA